MIDFKILLESKGFEMLVDAKKDEFAVVKEIDAYDPKAKIILITASDDQKVINQCMKRGWPNQGATFCFTILNGLKTHL